MTETYPRKLNGTGCLYGQRLAGRFDTWKDNLKEELKEDYKARMDNLECKIDGIQKLLIGTLTSLVLALVMLSLNLAAGLLLP